MYRRELSVIGAIGILLLLVMFAGCHIFLGMVQSRVEALAKEQMPRIVLTNRAMDAMLKNWSETIRLHSISEASLRSHLIQKINSNSTQPIWEAYSENLKHDSEKISFLEVMSLRSEFLELRSQYFQLLGQDEVTRSNTALVETFLVGELTPAFQRYLNAANQLLTIESTLCSQIAVDISKQSLAAQCTLAACSLSTLFLGCYVTLQLMLGAFRPSKVYSAVVH